MIMFKQYFDATTGEVAQFGILRVEDNVCIPFDPANTDYQAYLAWLAEGNVPEPAEVTE
jgi:hypothetical protein